MARGAVGDLFERSAPVKFLRQHSRRQPGCVRLRGRKLQSVCANGYAIRQDRRAFHGVLQLPHVSRPAIIQQALPRVLRELQSRLGKLPAELLQKVICQQQYVILALTQRRNRHRHRGNPEIQVLPEQFLLNLLL